MHEKRKWKPFWRWEVFLFAMVLLAAIVANFVSKAPWPVVGPILSIALLAVAVVFALLLIVPVFRPSLPDSEGSRTSLDGVALVPVDPQTTIRVVESERRQTAIDVARTHSRAQPKAVLTPDASRWLGRELRVAVDLVSDDGRIHRAGFVPRQIDAELDAALQPLKARGEAVEVQARINGNDRPFTVDILLGPVPA
jgi:hypothetical protein